MSTAGQGCRWLPFALLLSMAACGGGGVSVGSDLNEKHPHDIVPVPEQPIGFRLELASTLEDNAEWLPHSGNAGFRLTKAQLAFDTLEIRYAVEIPCPETLPDTATCAEKHWRFQGPWHVDLRTGDVFPPMATLPLPAAPIEGFLLAAAAGVTAVVGGIFSQPASGDIPLRLDANIGPQAGLPATTPVGLPPKGGVDIVGIVDEEHWIADLARILAGCRAGIETPAFSRVIPSEAEPDPDCEEASTALADNFEPALRLEVRPRPSDTPR